MKEAEFYDHFEITFQGRLNLVAKISLIDETYMVLHHVMDLGSKEMVRKFQTINIRRKTAFKYREGDVVKFSALVTKFHRRADDDRSQFGRWSDDQELIEGVRNMKLAYRKERR